MCANPQPYGEALIPKVIVFENGYWRWISLLGEEVWRQSRCLLLASVLRLMDGRAGSLPLLASP